MPKPDKMRDEAAKLRGDALSSPSASQAVTKLAEAGNMASDAGALLIGNGVEVDVVLDPPLAPITRTSRLEVP